MLVIGEKEWDKETKEVSHRLSFAKKMFKTTVCVLVTENSKTMPEFFFFLILLRETY